MMVDSGNLASPSNWPTKKNLVDALINVLRNCQAGDVLLFHYSGHGTLVCIFVVCVLYEIWRGIFGFKKKKMCAGYCNFEVHVLPSDTGEVFIYQLHTLQY